MLSTNDVISFARKHVSEGRMESSARLCLADAIELQAKGDNRHARERALRSLQYSVGVFHASYQVCKGDRK